MAATRSTNTTTRSSKLPVRRTSASTASIISSMTTTMPTNTNRHSLPALAESTRRAPQVTRNVQCTHLTTTRLFTKEFRCGICFREGSFGWVWRCTQDRELMLEDDLDHGHAVSFTKISPFLSSSVYWHWWRVKRNSMISVIFSQDQLLLDHVDQRRVDQDSVSSTKSTAKTSKLIRPHKSS